MDNFILICLEKGNSFNSELQTVPVTFLTKGTGKFEIGKLISLPLLAKKLKDLIASENIEWIQSHLQLANYVNILAKLMGANHFVQIVNTNYMSGYSYKGLLGRLHLWLIQFLYQHADMIVLKNKAMQKDVSQWLECRMPQKIIPNFFDIDDIDKQCDGSTDAMIFGFNENKIYITAMGHLEAVNNFDVLIQAFEKTCASVPQAELMIIGSGPELKSLIRLSKKCNVYERVSYVQADQIPYYYLKQSHIFVLSSSFHSFPDAIVEAMICELPVISSDCPGGPREILAPDTKPDQQLELGVEYAQYGVLVPVRDVDALSEAMTRLCLDLNRQYRYTKNSRLRAMDFHKDLILRHYEGLFHYKKEIQYDILRD
jgi:N-acetylgalactosamine-N,N'-diacetylbacillosaminyl-diphospho-undecaprenol 4-alpha-N-acetylgalactosaminyltransferase